MFRPIPKLSPAYIAVSLGWSIGFLVAAHTYPIPTFYSESITAIAWLALALIVLVFSWHSERGLPAVALAPTGLALVLLVQLQIAPPLNPILSFGAIVALLSCAGITGLASRCKDIPGIVQAIAVGLVVGAALMVGIELLQLFNVRTLPQAWVSLPPDPPRRRMWGNLNQANHVATYVAMGLAACMFLMYRAARWRWLISAIGLIFLVGMVLTFSRTAWIHVMVVGVLSGLLARGDERGVRGWLKVLAPTLALVVCYQLCIWLVGYVNVIMHFDLPTAENARQGISDRAPLWNHAWHMFLAHPWIGGGWGDYAYNQFVQTDVLGNVVMSMNAHNIVLDLLAKVGVLGLLAVALPCIGLVVTAWRRKLTAEYAFFYAVILMLAGHSMVEYPLHYVFFLFPFAFALGWVDDSVLRKPSPKMVWTLTTTFAVCGIALLIRLWPDYRVVEGLYYTQGDYQAMLKSYEKKPVTLLTPYANLAIAMNIGVSFEMANVIAAIEHQAVEFYPGPGTVQRYALALAFQGKVDDAVTQMRRLRHQYSADYFTQTFVTQSACSGKFEALKLYCVRLKAEGLLPESK
ncbi:PglL family O-oligosaccharyltransferase [Ralstonia flatus]|uniref:PglL family O-oligosaccharyltransferase n=1 Tax=Ralstonia flatus TaxID=3058601 RepID=UPI0029314AE0|nr:Wzy polymerase domain-containing protein [Ralstonia sp. LMG 32965]